MIAPKEVAQENNLGTGTFLFLNFITLGLYGLLRVIKMTDIIESFSEQKICSRNFIIFLSIAYGLSFLGLEIVYVAVLVYWSFLAKRELEYYTSYQMHMRYEISAFYIVIFNIYYVNYCLNDLKNISEMCVKTNDYNG